MEVGQIVRVIANTCGHEMSIGHITTIRDIVEENYYHVNEGWAVDDDDVEPINGQEDAK